MASFQTPGVYIDEVSGPGSIEGVPTWIPAFIGQTQKEVAGVPTLVTSWDDYRTTFDAPAWRSYLSWAVSQFFDEGGLFCYVFGLNNGVGSAANVVFTGTNTEAGYSATFDAAGNGLWGNLLWIQFDQGKPAVAGVVNLTVCVRDCDINPEFEANWANDTNKVSLMDRALLWKFVKKNSLNSAVNDLSAEGGGANDLVYTIESIAGLVLANMTDIASRINSNSSFVRFQGVQGKGTGLVLGMGWYPLGGGVKGTTETPTQPTADVTAAYNKGVDLSSGLSDYQGALAKLEGIPGISLIATPDIVTIEDVGEKTTLTTQLSIANAVASECKKAGLYWFYAVDPPALLNSNDTVLFKSGTYNGTADNPIVSSYAALFWPWLNIPHPTAGNLVFPVPPSGAVLARFVNTDLTVGVHQAAAGVRFGALSAVSSLDVDTAITDAEQDTVYPQGLNVIRNRIYYGVCIWGARTLSPDPQWKHIPVRRLFSFVEKSLIEGLQQFVFDVNNVHLWVSVTRDVTAFLVGLWKIGALFGRTQTDAFRVTCDESNNTPATIAQGYLNVKVEIAPVHPAEFIVIEISQKLASPDAGA